MPIPHSAIVAPDGVVRQCTRLSFFSAAGFYLTKDKKSMALPHPYARQAKPLVRLVVLSALLVLTSLLATTQNVAAQSDPAVPFWPLFLPQVSGGSQAAMTTAPVQPMASVGQCMVDRYNQTKPANVASLGCTSNDVQLAQYQLVSGPTSCLPGETITVGLKGEFLSTAEDRYDVGVFVATDGGTPNDLGGSCYNDFLHFASTTNTNINLTGGSGPFYNAELAEDTKDICGDIQQGNNAFLTISTVSLVCQDSNTDGTADVGSCTVWANSKSAGTTNKPSCTSELNTTAETTAKCTCQNVPIAGLTVPKTGTIVVNKVLTPASDPGKFNLQINGTNKAVDVGNGGTTGTVLVAAGTSASPGANHTVGEIAGTGTDLNNYNSSTSCTKAGLPTPDTDGTITVLPNDAWTCTITNTPKAGSLKITKTVNAGGSGFTSGSFGVSATCTNDPNSPYVRTISYPTTGDVTIAGIPANSVCTVTETSKPTAPAGYSWDAETITGSPATIPSGGTANVTVANKLSLIPNKSLAIVKTASPQTYNTVNQVISYSYLVTNNGSVTLAGPFTVSDDKATDESCPATASLAPGASITCTASYKITQADLDAGSVTNIAFAAGGGATSPTDTETVTAVQSRSLTLVKTATPATYDAVGDVISYSYLVTNNGNVRLAGPVTVTDDKATVTCPNVNTVGNLDGYLDPGESITCAASYSITQADLNNGSVTNTAKASVGGTDSNPDS